MFYFDNKPELRTSYANQRALALRDLPAGTECIHGEALTVRCGVCASSGTALVQA